MSPSQGPVWRPIARRLALGSGLRVLQLFVTSIVAFFLTPFVIRSLGDHTYGLWLLVAAFVGYYGLFDLGLGSAVTRYLAKAVGAEDDEEANRVFNTAILLFMALGLAVLAATTVLAALVPRFASHQEDAAVFAKLVLILGVNSAFDFPVRVFDGVLFAKLRHDLNVILNLVVLVIRSGLTVLVLLAGHKAVALALVTFLTGLVGAALRVYWGKKSFPAIRFAPRRFDWGTGKSLFSYSLYTLMVNVGDMVRYQLDNLVVGAFVGLAAVTHYSIGSSLAQYFTALMFAAVGMFNPVFSRLHGANDEEGIRKTFLFATRISTCGACFVGLGLIAWGRAFIERWMGTEYLDAYPVLVLLVTARILAAAQLPSVGLLFGVAKHKFFAISNAVEALLNLVLSLVLVRYYGILGVALGTLLPMFVTKLLVQPWWVCRVAGLSLMKYAGLVVETTLKSVLVFLVALLCCQWGLVPEYKLMMPSVILATLMYGVGAWFLVFGPQERERLLTALPLPFLSARSSPSGD